MALTNIPNQERWLKIPMILSLIFASTLIQIEQVTAGTCVTFPNDTSSCSSVALTCHNFQMGDGHITYDSFSMDDDANTRSPSTHQYATCRLSEVCNGTNHCDVIEDVLTELEPSLCAGMCYYVIIPHEPCTTADATSQGEGSSNPEHISTVYMIHVPPGNTDIMVNQVKSSTPSTNITVNSQCDGLSEGDPISTGECDIAVDQTCPGTNVQTFEANKTVSFEVSSVSGDESVAITFSTAFSEGVTALATIYDPSTNEDSEQSNVVDTDDGSNGGVIAYISSLVIDVIILDENGLKKELAEGEEIHLTFKSKAQSGFTERKCNYFVEDTRKWSIWGCYELATTDTEVTCACNHTTSFAVLLQFEDCSIDGANLQIQTLMTRFFNAISISALFLSVIIFTYLKLYTSDQVKVHICLAISLALAQLVMLFMDQTHHLGICRAIAGIMHYLLTAYCISMILEGVLLHRKASRTHKAPVKGWVLVLCVWGIPVVLVAVLMGSMIEGYGNQCACWLTVASGTIYVWLAQVCLVIVVNTVLLYLIMRTFVSLKANAKKSDSDRLKATARAVLIMVPMLGMTWVFALLQAAFKDVFLQWIFILLNALQGPLFFVFQCVMHPEVQKVIGRKRKVGDSSKWAMSSTSGTGRTESTDKGTAQSQFTETKLAKVR